MNETNGTLGRANETEVVGCPSIQTWCYYIPAMTISQFLLGYALTAIGYPIGVTLIQTIFSKILGPRPQVSVKLYFNSFLFIDLYQLEFCH